MKQTSDIKRALKERSSKDHCMEYIRLRHTEVKETVKPEKWIFQEH